jgi:putative MATE family efflux protein
MKDLTTGKPSKVIIMFAIPLMCGYIFQNLYNMVDSKIVSSYVGTNAFAAVGATSVVSNMIAAFINGLTQGYAIPVARNFGAKNYDRMRKCVAGTFVLTASVTVLLAVLSQIFIQDILRLLDTPAEIMNDAVSYVRIILFGIGFSALYNMCANLLRGVGDSKTPLYCLIASVIINIGLDLLFVNTFKMGIKGAAYATIISQAISGGACFIYMFARFREMLPKKESWYTGKDNYRELVSTGLSMGLMSCIVNIGTVVLQSAINSLGTDIVAAHTASRKVFDILNVMLYTIGLATTTFVSQNIGAGKTERVRTGIRQALIMVTVISTFLLVVCFAFANPVLRWLASTDKPEIIDSAMMYTRISICFFYALGPLFVLRMALQGMGRKIIPVFTSILEMILKICSAAFLVPALGYFGVALTEPISWCVMATVLAIAYFSKLPGKETAKS